MATEISLDDAFGPTAGGNTLVPASRTKRKSAPGLTLADIGGTSDKIGELPKDRNIFDLIKAEALANEVPEEFLFALANQESNYNPTAKNDEFGAAGIMQYIPDTAKRRGIDPMDPAASIRAAAQDFAAAMKEGGVEWAIKNHFAGPDVKGHGPKTRQYLADVTKRAEDIRSLLDTAGEPQLSVGGSSDVGPKQPVGKVLSLDEAFGSKPLPRESEDKSVKDFVLDGLANAAQIAGQKVQASWDFVQKRLADSPDTFLGQKVEVRERTPEEIDRYIKENPWAAPKGIHLSREGELKALREQLRFVRVVDESGKPVKAAEEVKPGFWANIDNPMKLLTEDSLPANIVEYLANLPAAEGRKFLDARKTIQQEQILANPTKHPAEVVDAARAAVTDRKAKQDAGIGDMWDDLKQAAKEDPGRFGAQLANAIMADPQMIAAPQGMGIRVLSGVRKAANVTEEASKIARAIQRTDKVIDAAVTGAGLNLSIEGAAAASEGRELTGKEALAAGGIGALLSGGPAAIFSRGAKARTDIANGNVNATTLEQALRDAAQEDLAIEQIVTKPDSVPEALRLQIEEQLGINKMTDLEKKKWHAARQKELRQTFQEQSLEADYLAFKAEERITRRTGLAEEGAAREAANAAEAKKLAEVEQAYAEDSAARSARFADEYEQAVLQREAAKTAQVDDAYAKEAILKDVTDKLDQEEIINAAFTEDVPAVRRAMASALQRDSKLARPKWQRGEIDNQLLARLGIGSLFAGTAYAVAPPENKVASAFAAGLAALVLPKGGNVLRRMRQSGAVSADGDMLVLARLVKDGKMKPTLEAADAKAKEVELINMARRGDQRAYKELFQEHYPAAERFARKFTRGADVEPEDVAQEAMVKAFQNLDKFDDTMPFGGWLYAIVKNEASNARRNVKTQKGGGDYQIESADRPDLVSPFGEKFSRDAFDDGAGADLADTPEAQAIRQDSERILTDALEKMNSRKRQTFILSKVEGYTAEEIAQLTDQPLGTVLRQLQTAQDEVLAAIEKGMGAKKKQVPSDDTISVWRVPKTGMNAPTEGVGMYASLNKNMAGQFGDAVEYKVAKPKKPLVVKEEPLYQLHEMDDIFDPISPKDSTWLKLNKMAAEVTMEQTGDPRIENADAFGQLFGENLTAAAKQAGYDAFDIHSGGDQWYVLFDGHKNAQLAKRGRGRPRKQVGEVDPALLKTAAILGIGGTAGAVFADKNKLIGALGGAAAGALLFGGGARGLKSAGKFADNIMGSSATRILNKSPSVHRRILTTERRILESTHQHIEQVDPFLVKLSKMPKAGSDILARALMTGKGAVIDKILAAFNDVELTSAYKNVRKSLDSLGDQLVNLKRFKRGNIEYFPRIVKDKEGLFKAIGKEETNKLQEILQDANVESLRKNGRPLSEIEESAIINQNLFIEKRGLQPGFTKNRGIEEITPELQPFYASPAESLHSYIRAAVQDIEGAKFFGDYAKNMQRGDHEFLDVDRSVKNLIAEDVKSGKLSNEDAHEVSEILRTRFKEGMRAENDLIRNIKNLGNIGLLGNFWSAATQMADVGVQVYTQGLRPTIESVVRQLTGNKLVDMRDFGLADHISEEFAGQLRTSRWVNKVFKATLFEGVDRFGKNTALNAAIINAKRLVETDSGVQRLANKYQEAFGDDFGKLVSELKSGKISDLTRDYAFMELSRTQPITRIEMPLAYLKHPNARSYLWLKSFTMKQIDLVRRDVYNEIKKGNKAKGIKNLTEIAVILGLSGATTEQVKAWMMGKDEQLELSDIPVNMFKTFGFSEYLRDQFSGVSKEEAAARRAAGDKGARTKKAQPISAIANSFMPPFRMFDQILSGDPAAIRFLVPGIGPYLAEQVKKENQLQKESGE